MGGTRRLFRRRVQPQHKHNNVPLSLFTPSLLLTFLLVLKLHTTTEQREGVSGHSLLTVVAADWFETVHPSEDH